MEYLHLRDSRERQQRIWGDSQKDRLSLSFRKKWFQFKWGQNPDFKGLTGMGFGILFHTAWRGKRQSGSMHAQLGWRKCFFRIKETHTGWVGEWRGSDESRSKKMAWLWRRKKEKGLWKVECLDESREAVKGIHTFPAHLLRIWEWTEMTLRPKELTWWRVKIKLLRRTESLGKL